MLEIIQDFIVIFIEISTLLILWSNLTFKEKSNIKINIFITFISTSITVIASNTDIAYITLVAYLSIIFLIKIFYNKPLVRASLEFFVFAFVISIFQLAVIVVINETGIGYLNTFSLNLMINLIILILVVMLCYYILKYRNRISYFLNLDSKVIYCLVINLGVYLIIVKLIWDYNKNLILSNLIVCSIISIGIFILNMLLYFYIAKITEEKKILEIQKQYEPILGEVIEEIRRKQHDFKNYLNAISGIIDVVNEDQLKIELKKYINNLNRYNKSLEDIMYIGNITVRATVYNKLCEAERLNIKFLYYINDNLLQNILNDYEISDILSNLINNAFEAVLNTDNKVVILNIVSKENTTIIEVKNSGITIKPKDLDNIFKRGFSTKGENRGYGLYNIKKIVEGSGGKIQLSFDDDYTIFKILFKHTLRWSITSEKQKAI